MSIIRGPTAFWSPIVAIVQNSSEMVQYPTDDNGIAGDDEPSANRATTSTGLEIL
jgi:hypothetical protein